MCLLDPINARIYCFMIFFGLYWIQYIKIKAGETPMSPNKLTLKILGMSQPCQREVAGSQPLGRKICVKTSLFTVPMTMKLLRYWIFVPTVDGVVIGLCGRRAFGVVVTMV